MTDSAKKGIKMLIRKAEAKWKGNLIKGSGRLTVGSRAIDVPYSFKSRLEDGQSATNPEELLGAAHAGCFTMALAAQLSSAGFTPTELDTVAKVSFEKIGENFQITRIELETSADVTGVDDTTFQALAADAKKNCPVSKALAATEIKLKATLKNADKSKTPTEVAIGKD
jgi:osmotically inducible protein OsmC